MTKTFRILMACLLSMTMFANLFATVALAEQTGEPNH